MLKQIQIARDALKAAAPFIETARLAADALRSHREQAAWSQVEVERAALRLARDDGRIK